MTKFFSFRQNNSGGSFRIDETNGIGDLVIIEANDAKHALSIAEKIGIYFNGVNKGFDCKCCGDRWYGIDEITDEPMYNDSPITQELVNEIIYHLLAIHFLDGTIKMLEPIKYKI